MDLLGSTVFINLLSDLINTTNRRGGKLRKINAADFYIPKTTSWLIWMRRMHPGNWLS